MSELGVLSRSWIEIIEKLIVSRARLGMHRLPPKMALSSHRIAKKLGIMIAGLADIISAASAVLYGMRS